MFALTALSDGAKVAVMGSYPLNTSQKPKPELKKLVNDDAWGMDEPSLGVDGQSLAIHFSSIPQNMGGMRVLVDVQQTTN